jgi:hypothetical protein
MKNEDAWLESRAVDVDEEGCHSAVIDEYVAPGIKPSAKGGIAPCIASMPHRAFFRPQDRKT